MKRALDASLASASLIALSPLLTAICALEIGFHGWPPVFAQERGGYQGSVFTLYKFRTMTNARNAAGDLLSDAERLTPFGRFLRATSLDELPELFNVLLGDMSLVGPRPLLSRYLGRYSAAQKGRHHVKPGLTGWAQVNGRNAIGWEEKFALDLWYVENWSLLLDAKILLKTVASVLLSHGIAAEGDATMPEFLGANGAPERQGHTLQHS